MASKSLPPPPRPKVFAISKLRKCPVQVNLHTEQLIEAIRSSLEEGRAAPGITVGIVGGVHYIVDGHARVEACDRAEFVEINVGEVLELGSMADLLIEHVRRNIRSPLNPVKVLGVAALLAKQGVERPLSVLHLTPVMEGAVRVLSMWPGELVGMVSDLIDRKSGRFSDVYAVPHFFTAFQDLSFRVDRREKGAQEELKGIVTYIVRYLDSIGDEREFAFPGPDQILALMRDRKKQIKMAAQVAKSSSRASSTSERPARKQQSHRGGGEREEDDAEGDDEVGYEEPLMMPDRNKSVIKCTQCGSPQVVDLKSGHVCPVETVAGGMIDVIRDVDDTVIKVPVELRDEYVRLMEGLHPKYRVAVDAKSGRNKKLLEGRGVALADFVTSVGKKVVATSKGPMTVDKTLERLDADSAPVLFKYDDTSLAEHLKGERGIAVVVPDDDSMYELAVFYKNKGIHASKAESLYDYYGKYSSLAGVGMYDLKCDEEDRHTILHAYHVLRPVDQNLFELLACAIVGHQSVRTDTSVRQMRDYVFSLAGPDRTPRQAVAPRTGTKRSGRK